MSSIHSGELDMPFINEIAELAVAGMVVLGLVRWI